jgi:GNAT superfamily N-acetyltransferase
MAEHSGLVHRALWTRARYLALGNESFEADGAFFVRNGETPRRYDANHVSLIRVSEAEDIERLLRRAESEFDPAQSLVFHADALTPPEFVARLTLELGSTNPGGLFLILEGMLHASAPKADIREVTSDEQWDAYRQLVERNEQDWMAQNGETLDDELAEQFIASKRLKNPPERTWLAYVDGDPVAYFSSWVDSNGMGLIEDLYTHPDFRLRGLATALVMHCIEDARARGAGPVLIGANPSDTPKNIYARMGFRPRYVTTEFRRPPRKA